LDKEESARFRSQSVAVDPPKSAAAARLGLTGAVDTVMLLWREGSGTVLAAKGRDVEETTKAVVFNRETCIWSIIGDADAVKRSTERETIMGAFAEASDEAVEPAADRGGDWDEADQRAQDDDQDESGWPDQARQVRQATNPHSEHTCRAGVGRVKVRGVESAKESDAMTIISMP
jgi:hypothetical protein